MSVLIDVVRIFGFRGIENLEITLPRVTVLIGTNNAGKTSVIKALQLAFGDYSRYLAFEDFHVDSNDKTSESIVIDARVIAVNDKGERTKAFLDEWLEEFGGNISADAAGNQFLAIRTICKYEPIKGGFLTNRFSLENWPELAGWQTEKVNTKRKITKRFDGLPFISIDAQRDIHQELREKSSFIGKILSGIEFDNSEVTKLESMIADINKEAVDNSSQLKTLKIELEKLSRSFQGSGQAEISPFPKKIRDISKQFTVNFGSSDNNSFSMEYHGMGTRSWASMLTVKAFTSLMEKAHSEEEKPFFPITAAEEPEAHLHPNAQRTIYKQLTETNGQVIISTHSPYLAALADQMELRYLSANDGNVEVRKLNDAMSPENRRRLQREVIHSRGELLFSKALVLSEGETEEQALPEMFYKYFDEDAFSLGVNFIGVGGSGAKYLPFLVFAHDFGIPVFIFSDGEPDIVKALKKNYELVHGSADVNNHPNITILDGTDFEGYLLDNGYSPQIETAIMQNEGKNCIDNRIKKLQATKTKRIKTDKPPCDQCGQPIYEQAEVDAVKDVKREAIIRIIDSHKPMYAKSIAEELCKLDSSKLPPKIIDLFEKIKVGVDL